MVGSKITFKGFKKAHNFLINLPKKLDKHLSKTNEDFMEDIKNDAIKFAPEDAGALKASIQREPVRKGKNVKVWKVVVNEPYGIYQEEGFTPHFTFVGHSAKYPAGRWWVKKWTPFMKPAFQKNEAEYLNMLKVSTKRALAN